MELHHHFERKLHLGDVPEELKMIAYGLLIYTLGWAILKPYISIYFHNILGTYSGTGIVVGSLSLIQMLIAAPLGDLLDKIGRKNWTIFSLLNYVIVGPAYWLAGSLYQLFIVRIYNAFTASGVWIGSKALVRDFSRQGKEAEGMGYFGSMLILAKLVGPLLAAVIVAYFTIKDLFLILPFTALVATFVVKLKVPESLGSEEKVKDGMRDLVKKDKIFWKEAKDFFSTKENFKISFCHFVKSFNLGIALMILALFVKEMGAELWQIGLIYSLFYLPFLPKLEFGHLADKIGRAKIAIIGSLISSLFFFLLFYVNSIFLVFCLTLFASLGLSILGPAIQGFITETGKGKEGEITGLYQSIKALGYGSGPLVAGFLSDLYSLSHAFLLCSGASLLIFLIFSADL